jgi:hypothetical protein
MTSLDKNKILTGDYYIVNDVIPSEEIQEDVSTKLPPIIKFIVENPLIFGGA